MRDVADSILDIDSIHDDLDSKIKRAQYQEQETLKR